MYIYQWRMLKLRRMSHQINVSVPDEVYERAKAAASAAPMFFKAWIQRALEEKCDRDEKKAAR